MSKKTEKCDYRSRQVRKTAQMIVSYSHEIARSAGKQFLDFQEISSRCFFIQHFTPDRVDPSHIDAPTGVDWIKAAFKDIGRRHGIVPFKWLRRSRTRNCAKLHCCFDLNYIALIGEKEAA